MLKNIVRATLLTLILTTASWAQGNSGQLLGQMMAAVQQKSGQTQSLIQRARQSGDQSSLQVLQYEAQMHQHMYQMLSQMQPMAAEFDRNPQALRQLQTVWQEYDYRSTNHDWGQNQANSYQQPGFQSQPNYQAQPPSYQSNPGYQQQPAYQANPGYQQAPAYQTNPGYQQPHQMKGTGGQGY